MPKTYSCKDCKYLYEPHDGKYVCTKHNTNNPKATCDDFDKLKFCDTCTYSKSLVYETETIDCIDYRCMLQGYKCVYSDMSPMRLTNALYPECILDMYEEKE